MLLNILIPLIGVVADQLVKYWASTALREAGTIPLWEGVFHLTYCENTGAAFSLLSGHRWVLLAVTAAALIGMFVALSKNYMKNAFGRTSLRLIIAGAVGNMLDRFLLGYVVEFSEATLERMFGDLGLGMRIVFLVIGIVVTCIAAALYYSADLGVSTYDAIPLHIASLEPRLFGHVLPFRVVRIISDVICTAVGVALGARAGLGTVVTALFMGPLIAFFRRTISDPLVQQKAA